MGFLSHKKGKAEQASILSEEEIQKRLYGEFKKDPTRIAGGSERESASQVSHAMHQPSTVETAPDLFTEPQKPAKTEHPDFPSPVRVTESVQEPGERTVMPTPISTPTERKYQSSVTSSVSDPYQRYRELNKPKAQNREIFQKTLTAAGDAWEFVKELFESNRFFTRQVLYWTGGVVVVFFLFWSVNALNAQREQAMQTSYPTQQDKTLSAAKRPVASSAQETRPVATKKVPVISDSPISKPKTPASVQPVVVAAAWSYVIQVVTYPSADYAERVVTSLRQAGFDAFAKEDVRSTGTVFYVVMIGGFPTALEAQQGLAKFRTDEIARPFSDAFVKRTR